MNLNKKASIGSKLNETNCRFFMLEAFTNLIFFSNPRKPGAQSAYFYHPLAIRATNTSFMRTFSG